MRTCLHQIGLGPCLWSTSLIADWLEGARTKQVGVGCVKRLVDHESKTKLEKKCSLVCASLPASVSLNEGLSPRSGSQVDPFVTKLGLSQCLSPQKAS